MTKETLLLHLRSDPGKREREGEGEQEREKERRRQEREERGGYKVIYRERRRRWVEEEVGLHRGESDREIKNPF